MKSSLRRGQWSMSTGRKIVTQIHVERELHRAFYTFFVLHVKKEKHYFYSFKLNLNDKTWSTVMK